MNKTLQSLIKMRGFLVTLAVIGLIGYTARLVGQIVAVTPDKDYLEQAKHKADIQTIKLDTKAVDNLKGLVPVDSHIDSGSVGKGDPFAS
jgi:hypothetical protein